MDISIGCSGNAPTGMMQGHTGVRTTLHTVRWMVGKSAGDTVCEFRELPPSTGP